MDAGALVSWLKGTHQVSISRRVCQHWLNKEWNGSGVLTTPEAVEEVLGMRLRLNEYRDRFAEEGSAEGLAEVLSESQPPAQVSGLLLRQWYTKFHPDSGPVKNDTAEAMEEGVGDHSFVLNVSKVCLLGTARCSRYATE